MGCGSSLNQVHVADDYGVVSTSAKHKNADKSSVSQAQSH